MRARLILKNKMLMGNFGREENPLAAASWVVTVRPRSNHRFAVAFSFQPEISQRENF
jgi:hypothetical protein